ncbi:CBO0543 family protein [uncultured Paenibacillus sp.]|uniref:CBO0543 family protein n=1 Tax=uncultured Paenibacillus sp. TaxID=227322 RepID=UPI0028D34CA2|nr:CBO0543 family protein [uncultured Paenibacillus sp.]
MHFIYNGLFLLAALKWGDWKNWRAYYPTVLFFIVGDLLKNVLFHDRPMWMYQEIFWGEEILFSHKIISLMIMFVVYPSTVLIYLGRFPKKTIWKQGGWITLWVLLYIIVEYVNLRYLDLIDHFHGWNIWWSAAFNVIMFSMLLLHYRHPLWAWAGSFVTVIVLWILLRVPISVLEHNP